MTATATIFSVLAAVLLVGMAVAVVRYWSQAGAMGAVLGRAIAEAVKDNLRLWG